MQASSSLATAGKGTTKLSHQKVQNFQKQRTAVSEIKYTTCWGRLGLSSCKPPRLRYSSLPADTTRGYHWARLFVSLVWSAVTRHYGRATLGRHGCVAWQRLHMHKFFRLGTADFCGCSYWPPWSWTRGRLLIPTMVQAGISRKEHLSSTIL